MTAAARALRRLTRWPASLRARLVAVILVLLTVVFAAAALVTLLVVRSVLIDRLDDQLRSTQDRYLAGIGRSDVHPVRYATVEGQQAGTLGARIVDGRVVEAAVVGAHNTASALGPDVRGELARVAPGTSPRWVVLSGLDRYRVVAHRESSGDIIVTGLPYDPVDDTVDRLVLDEAGVFVVALLLVGAATTGLVRFMLRPLARVAGTAADIADLPMGSGEVSLPYRAPTGNDGSEVDTLTRAFNGMLEQVETALVTRAESEDRLRRFIADASHELRTPVAVVRSHAELAQRAGGAGLPADVQHSLERITAQAGRMGHLVEDLLLLARLDSGRPLARERLDLTHVVIDALDDARTTRPDHRWRLALPAHSVFLDGDAHALGQATSNLLVNAAAHTPAGTTVTLSLREAPDVDGSDERHAVVEVCDDGPGMSADLARRAFDRFVRGENERAVATGSSGLGLPIVSAIVAAHRGDVDLASGPDGTRVTLTLPSLPRPDESLDEDSDEWSVLRRPEHVAAEARGGPAAQ